MCVHLDFEYQKATQALNYFAATSKGRQISKLKALKFVYLADRYHLRKYGMPITGDEYYAMELGPVPSGTKNIADFSNSGEKDYEYASKYIKTVDRKTIHSIQKPDMDVFSKSDTEALSYVVKHFFAKRDVVEFTHKFPEWKKHERALDLQSRARMDLADFLENADKKVEFYPLAETDIKLGREYLKTISDATSAIRG
jgi:hypothetical protein